MANWIKKKEESGRKKQKRGFGKGIKEYFADFVSSVKEGDWGTRASLLVMGSGFVARKQYVKGILITLVQILYLIIFAIYSVPYLSKFGTLGTVKMEQSFDPITMQQTTNDYDNSFLILIHSMISLFLLVVFVMYYIHNIKAAYKVEQDARAGRPVNSFRQDMKEMLGKNFHFSLLTLPTIGVIVMNILPILVLVAIAFTNYDQNHMPPAALFTWVGFENFKALISNGGMTITFGYAFWKVLSWTLVWAVLATFTNFIGGIVLAVLINSKGVKYPKMWRSLFVVAIAVPQFVTLILVRNFFRDDGIVNTLCANAGITDFFKSIGLLGANMNYIPFLTSKGWAKVMIVLINIWVGIPYQMLIATGVLMNAPLDQVESARIDGASKSQIFWKITIPYILVVQGPALITDFVRNINNFNVIYLLTQDVYTTTDQMLANSNAKEVDLLVTWLFRLTNEYYNYKMASVIGIIVFIICVAFTLVSYSRLMAGGREEDYQI
ncbi:MAG: sugar ABC transporter permease [Lachnospiraceae bacterium]|nr:sugar ABC transporter permease [Lachnospiraceae bacterium]